jgi:tetratricopeptide (TPR) repeat protein
MRALSPRTLLAALLLTLAACAAHDKAGDKAAAVGDWKTAFVEYRQAVADDPKDPALKARFAEARQKALAQATNQARACAAQGQWECALHEAEFSLSIDPTSPEMGHLRTDASVRVALGAVQRADGELTRGNVQAAKASLDQARQLSSDRAVDEAARAVELRWVGSAMAEAERLRQARHYPEAIALATAAAGYDPSVRPQLDRLNREYEAFREAEFVRLAQEGDRAMAQGAWGEAGARYQAALANRTDERVRALERYCALVQQGDQAVARGDFPGASRAYRDAAGLRVDRSNYADAQLARVAVRPWAVTVRGVLIDPVRPDGTPWIGRPSRRLNEVARLLAAGAGAGVDARLLRAAGDVPKENRPALFVEVVLPDGQRLASAVRDGPYFTLDASFVVNANGFDKRRLTLRVVHQERGEAAEPVGEVVLPVGDLIGRAAGSVSAPPLLAVELLVDPADGAAAGAGRGFAPVVEAARPPPPPKPGQTPPPPKK